MDGVFAVDQSGKISILNSAARAIFSEPVLREISLDPFGLK